MIDAVEQGFCVPVPGPGGGGPTVATTPHAGGREDEAQPQVHTSEYTYLVHGVEELR